MLAQNQGPSCAAPVSLPLVLLPDSDRDCHSSAIAIAKYRGLTLPSRVPFPALFAPVARA
ncbi:hypothetical protein AXK58_18015 [Tsukamurella tyrosinosolvens]|uniref:Uncharacterized protein n=1 Tax=Tsukamurella tyrosinosolvens TaxID=57704 RepID=A0A1H4RKY8_TSUTY|nr:hypothetical protein AXK58_18015 [Tsukamurella tyrosinosolvens]RDB45654.1 hypothetical protein DVB87_22290 [Tsukamurella tyrosinosolvens]SEC32537.1 hypothetical protein SAMN04489793_2019 [Tsukamurella tyrosinosolvens]